MADGMITKNLSKRNTDANSSFGIAKLAIAVSATTITTIVLTMPASTADCPTIRPPTIPIVLPSGPGRRIPASRKSSNRNSIRITSTTTGNVTMLRADAIAYRSFVGRISL